MKKLFLLIILLGFVAYALYHMNPQQSSRTASPQVGSVGVDSVVGPPTVTAARIDQVLCGAGSPACHTGNSIYELGVKYDIDPAFAVAFFRKESSYGLAGEATYTHSPGNLRCIPDVRCVDQDRGGYAWFPSWTTGFEAWYKLIHDLYVVQWGCKTIPAIVQRYAPSSENDTKLYISNIEQFVQEVRAA